MRFRHVVAVFAVLFISACRENTPEQQAAFDVRNSICGKYKSTAQDTLYKEDGDHRLVDVKGMNVISFTDGRVLRTSDVPGTQLMVDSTYVFLTYGKRTNVNRVHYDLKGPPHKVSSCDSLPPTKMASKK